MASEAAFSTERRGEVLIVTPSGDWTSFTLGDAPRWLEVAVAGAVEGRRRRLFDATSLGAIDTAGALALARAVWRGRSDDVDVELAGRADLDHLRQLVGLDREPAGRVSRPTSPLRRLFIPIGRAVASVAMEAVRDQAFVGRLVGALARCVASPRRLRPAPVVAAMAHAGLEAMPIVFAMSFFIGAILALVGSTMLRALGLQAYSVEMVGIGVMREFGVVVSAILFAGRSASAFAAQIGSMRMTQETDAMEVMGVDVMDAVVVPRVIAALTMLPLLTLVADVGGLFGGMIVAWASMGISPSFFSHRLVAMVGVKQFWIGMSKAPFFAIAVAATGCRHGLAASGDVGSLGLRVTSAVVQAIFMILMFDALFALLFVMTDR